jgi:hypothetical protein
MDAFNFFCLNQFIDLILCILKDDRTNFSNESRCAPFFVIADVVFLAAGTLGSNEILLRSKSYGGLEVSDRLGKGFSGNGDVGILISNLS